MKKLFLMLPLAALMLMVTLQVQQTPQTVAQDEEGECQLMDAPQLGEGWQRRVCQNSDYDSWISPDGDECFANERSGNTRCGDDPPINVQ